MNQPELQEFRLRVLKNILNLVRENIKKCIANVSTFFYPLSLLLSSRHLFVAANGEIEASQ